MNALNESARIVDTAWCKGSLKDEADAKEKGDTYCAVGAMAHAFSLVNGLNVDWFNGVVGDEESLDKYNKALKTYQAEMRVWNENRTKWREENPGSKWADYFDVEDLPVHPSRENVTGIEEFIGGTKEGLALAQAIIANFSDRFGFDYSKEELENADLVSEIIINFNDNDETTREEVVAMMEKAAISLDDAAVAEDKSTDDLVEEIDELLGV